MYVSTQALTSSVNASVAVFASFVGHRFSLPVSWPHGVRHRALCARRVWIPTSSKQSATNPRVSDSRAWRLAGTIDPSRSWSPA